MPLSLRTWASIVIPLKPATVKQRGKLVLWPEDPDNPIVSGSSLTRSECHSHGPVWSNEAYQNALHHNPAKHMRKTFRA